MADQTYNSPEDMASSLLSSHSNSEQKYDSPEDMANQLINGPPTTSQKVSKFARDLSGDTYDTFFGSNGILTNAAAAGADAWGAKPFQRSLDAFTNLKDTDGTLTKLAKGFNSVVMRPIAGAADAALVVGATDLTAISGFGLRAASTLGSIAATNEQEYQNRGTFGKILGAPQEAVNLYTGEYAEILGAVSSGEYFGDGGHIELEHKTTTARAKAALGEGEDNYFNTVQPHPEDLEARQTAANKAGIDPAPTHPTTNTNIDWVARQTNPDAFKEWDAKLDYHDELSNRLNQLQAQEPETSTLLGESPELAQAKEAFRENYNRLQELEPEINDAYKHADSLMPDQDELQKTIVEQEEARTASRKAQEAQEDSPVSESTPAQETPVSPSERLWRAPEGSISDDVTKKMIATGTDPEVAKAAGVLSETHYNARADRFGGRLGTAKQIYDREGPTITKGIGKGSRPAKGVKAKVLNQIAEVRNRLVVARRMPDGTIEKGKPGQLHYDLINEDELERRGLGFVGMDEADMGFATPDGKYLTRQEALDWVKEHSPDLKEALLHGGPRARDALESTGYEKELFNRTRQKAATEGPIYNQETPEDEFKTTAGKVQFEHDAEVADIARQAVEDFHNQFYGADRFKPKEPEYHQEDKQPIFYSALSRSVDNLDIKKGSPEQWTNTINNLQGVKKEEVEWSGLKEWLKEQKGTVTKEDVQDFLKQNEVQIHEVEKSGGEYFDPITGRFHAVGTKYSSYKLPGGENYKELLLTLPNKDVMYATGDFVADKGAFRSMHWDEPNVLSHIRFDDRTGPNGEKLLHIAEVQSDWHQAGRKRGYADPESIQKLADIKAELDKIRPEVDRMLQRHYYMGYNTLKDARYQIIDAERFDYDTPADLKLAKDYARLVIEKDRLTTRIARIPDAPFKQTWQELSMKRMLRYAVENGYDKISWDTGKTNFERMSGNKEEGQAGFYDKILPDFMRKYIKKWDGKVDKTEIQSPFKGEGLTGEQVLRAEGVEGQAAIDMWRDMSQEERDKYMEHYRNKNYEAHSVHITPKMRESVMEGQPLFQKKKGSLQVLSTGRNILKLFKAQDASTPFHELGHQWLEELSSDVNHPEAPDELKQDWDTVKDFLNISDDQKGITAPQHELWARTFERYLREGIAPSEGLKAVFEKIKSWLIQVYKSVTDLNAPISDPVRKVFDRLLTEQEIKKEFEEKVPQEAETAKEPNSVQEELEQRTRPSHKRLPEVKGTGEEANYGLANRINTVLQDNFDSELNDMDTRQRAQFKVGQAQVAEHVASNPQEAYEIAIGNRPSRSIDMTPEMYWNAMTQYATTKKDLQMLSDLSESRLVREVTTMAQRLASLRSGYDTVAMPNVAILMRSIEDARKEYFQRGNASQPGSQGLKIRKLSPEEQTKLVDLTDRVQQNYLKYKTSDNYNDRIIWGNSFLDLKKYVDSLKPKFKNKVDMAQEYTGEAIGAFKQMQTGIGHLSAVMVQGLGSMSHPEFYKGAREMLKYFANEDAYKELQAYIITDPWYRHAQKANLGMTNISTKLNNLEEELGSHLLARINQYAADKSGLPINIMGASSRAFTGYLNYLRFNVFTKSMEAAKLAGEDVSVDSQTSKDIAEAINNFTGRANLGKNDSLRNASRALNMLFYAPRKLVSTFEVFNPWQYLKPQSATARKLKFRNLMGVSLGVGSALLLARSLGAEVNLDPTNNDGNLIKIGKTGLDIMPGFRTAIRFIAQEGSGIMRTKDGKTIDLTSGDYNSPNRATVALSFLRGKESPFASIVTDKMMNSDAIGNQFNLTREMKNKLTPIFLNNMINFTDNDAENGAAWPLAAMSLFGVGISEPIPEPERQGLNWWGEDYGSTETKSQNDLDNAFKAAGFNPSFPSKTIKGVKLTDEQYHDYIKTSGVLLANYAKFVTSLPGWNNESQDSKKKTLRLYMKAARTQAANGLGIQPANQKMLDQWNNNPNPGLEPELQQLYQTKDQANPQ